MKKKLNAQSKGLETIATLTGVGVLTLPGLFTREKVKSPARVSLALRWGNLPTRVTLAAL